MNGTRLRSTPLPTCKDSPRSRPFTFFAIFLFFISACCRFLFIGITKKLLQTTLHELPVKEVKKTLRKLKNIISDLKDSTLYFILELCMVCWLQFRKVILFVNKTLKFTQFPCFTSDNSSSLLFHIKKFK